MEDLILKQGGMDGGGECWRAEGGEWGGDGGGGGGVKVQGRVLAVMKYGFVKERQFYRSGGCRGDIKGDIVKEKV